MSLTLEPAEDAPAVSILPPLQTITSTASRAKTLTSEKPKAEVAKTKRTWAFWMVIIANLSCDFLSALDLTAIATALPTIVEEVHGTDFIWASTSYALASTAILPMCGPIASAFGRKPVLLTFIVIFAAGATICGAAQNMNMLIAGRTIQGLGGGGCLALVEIIYADLIPLAERGAFIGISASIWAFASAIGPPIGGALATGGAWRWLFFLNLPVCAIAAALELFFLNVKTPEGSIKGKLSQLDWIGNFLVIEATTVLVLAMTWGGSTYPWVSYQVLVPLIIGILSFICFFIYEAKFAKHPTIPWSVVSNRTSFAGYLATFLQSILAISAIYYLPIYFQASKLATAMRSGVLALGLAFTVAPAAIAAGALVQACRRYIPFNIVGWIFLICGFAASSTIVVDTSISRVVGFEILIGVGVGMMYVAPEFAILSPLPFSNNAHALAFYTFVRSFSQTLGIAIGGAILQNQLQKHLPASFLAQYAGSSSQIAYAIIPTIPTLGGGELEMQVREAFADSVSLIWKVMAILGGVGLLTVALMKEYPLQDVAMDQSWALQEKQPTKKDKAADAAAAENEEMEMDDIDIGSPTSFRSLGDDVIIIGPPVSRMIVHEV